MNSTQEQASSPQIELLQRNKASLKSLPFVLVLLALSISVLANILFLIGKKDRNSSSFIEETRSVDLSQFIPNKSFENGCASGEQGVFNSDGTVSVTWGRDFVPNDTRPNQSIGQWQVKNNKLIISGTSLSDGEHDLIFTMSEGQKQVAKTFEEGCGITIQPQSGISESYELTAPTTEIYNVLVAFKDSETERCGGPCTKSVYFIRVMNSQFAVIESKGLDGPGAYYIYTKDGQGWEKLSGGQEIPTRQWLTEQNIPIEWFYK